LTGGIWLVHGIPKFLHSAKFMPPAGVISTYVGEGVAKTTGPYHDFLVGTVQPNIGIFGELVRLGEVCVGISLFLGLFSRLGGLFGILLPLNYVAARGGLSSASAWASLDGALMLLSAISLVLPAGRVLGLDAFLVRGPARRQRVVAEVVPEPPLERPSAPR
jgi:uncharacterized membrane protein YphA (DoxX/SURF4 family)